MARLTRRQLLTAGAGAVGLVAAGGAGAAAMRLLYREDLVPGEAVERSLAPRAWEDTADHLTFVALGDSGSGGRQAVQVAASMADTYDRSPYGLVAHLGDLCYYGSIEERFEDVFLRPMAPLVDAGVTFELAVGNHDGGLYYSDESLAEIERTLELLGTPSRYYTTAHGPADFFYLDSSQPAMVGAGGREQLEWLEAALAAADRQWRIVVLHHPLYSSGLHGSTLPVREALEPFLRRGAVDLVLSGHDHHYERTVPIHGTTHVVSGGGCKTTPVGHSDFTATAASSLEFVHLEIDDDRLEARAIQPDGALVDRFTLRAREGR